MEKIYLPLKQNSQGLTHLKVQKYYEKGGMNYFHGSVRRRGVYVSATPITLEKKENYTTESVIMLGPNSGLCKLVLEQKRHNQKAFEAIELKESSKEIIETVLNKCCLELEPETQPQ